MSILNCKNISHQRQQRSSYNGGDTPVINGGHTQVINGGDAPVINDGTLKSSTAATHKSSTAETLKSSTAAVLKTSTAMICQLFLVVSSRLTSKVSIEQMNMRINNPVMKHYTIKNFFFASSWSKIGAIDNITRCT